jgi:predicted PurR-regulated permease PerM
VAPLAVLVFIGGFIPLIGAVVFGGLAVLVTLVTNGATAAVVVLVVLVVENQIEGHVLQPFVVGRHVSLHPMAIALTLASGAVLAGLPGAIFGVPLVAALNAAAVELLPPKGTDRRPSAGAVELAD